MLTEGCGPFSFGLCVSLVRTEPGYIYKCVDLVSNAAPPDHLV